MGWLTMASCRNAKDVHSHVLGPKFCGVQLKPVAHFSAAYGRRFWVVFEYIGGERDSQRFVCLFLIGADHSGWWGYKPVAEDEGPREVDCPLKYITELVPEPANEWSREWRERVRAFHASKRLQRSLAKIVTVGDQLYLKPGCRPAGPLTVTSARPVRATDGWSTFRIPARLIHSVVSRSAPGEPPSGTAA